MLLVALAVGALSALQPASQASAVTGSQFQAGNIISNALFYDGNAMTQSQIQTFLNQKIGNCGNANCLNVLAMPTSDKAARNSPTGVPVCRAYQGSASDSAAAIIFKVQQACGISAKVLLVTLQKEQGLVTHTAPTAGRLARAMGYGCPDNTGGTCDSLYYGFFNQMYMAAWQLKRYGTAPVVGNYQIGLETVLYSPVAGCPATTVNVLNAATAALYNYTPYQPNAAALNNLYGTGDACSSYGNRNFWRYYNDWFGSTTSSPGTPEGTLDPIVPLPGVIPLTGWVVDTDAVTAPVVLSIQLDSTWSATTASLPGADLGARYPGAGANHYFSTKLAASPGQHTLCVYLVNASGIGNMGSLGCQTVTVPAPPAPVGAVTAATATNGTISFSGWAVQPDRPTNPVPLAVSYGSQWIPFTANQPNTTAPTAHPGAGPNQGFAGSFAAATGVQSFCVWASPSSGTGVNLGCRSVVVPAAVPTVAAIETVTGSSTGVSVSGYAVWPASPSTSVGVAVNIGSSWYPLTANQASPTGAAAAPGTGSNHGYAGSFPLAPGSHSVCIWVTQANGAAPLNVGCRTATVSTNGATLFEVTSIAAAPLAVTFSGWAVWPGAVASSVPIAVNIGSSWYPFAANQPNAAGAAAVPGSGTSHGFGGTISVPVGKHTVCIWASKQAGGATNLGCQTVTVAGGLPGIGEMKLTPAVGGVHFDGWAVNPSAPTATVPIAANIGSTWIPLATGEANAVAPTKFSGAGPNQGFSGIVPTTTGPQVVCIWASGATGAVNLGCGTVTVQPAPALAGALTSAVAGTGSIAVSGWALWPSTMSTGVPVAANVGTTWVALPSTLASTVASKYVVGAGPNQGFAGTIAAPAGSRNVCIWASPPSGSAVMLGCSTVVVT